MSSTQPTFDPFADSGSHGRLKRDLPPDTGDFERSVLGLLAMSLPEDVLTVADSLPPTDMQWPLHQALYKRIVKAIRNGTSVMEQIADCDPWLESDVKGTMPRKYLGFAMDVAAENGTQLAFCIEQIRDGAARRRRFEAARRAMEIACDTDKSIGEIDTATNALFKRAREQMK